MKSKTLTTAMAIVLGTGLAASALAAPQHLYEEHAVKVSYDDLNIDNDAGVETLYRRLKNASAEVCGYSRFKSQRPVLKDTESRLCYQKTLTRAVQQIDSDKLNKLHNG